MVWIWVLKSCTVVVHAVTFLEGRVWLQRGLDLDRASLVTVGRVGHPETGYPRTPSAERKVDGTSIWM